MAVLLAVSFWQLNAAALTVTVVDNSNNPITGGFRWLLEEDNTNQPNPPGVRVANSLGVDIHKSYAPLVNKGTSTGSSATITTDFHGTALDPTKRYYLSVLPISGYTLGGTQVAAGATSVTAKVHAHPLPTAQISILVFQDHNTINNVHDPGEAGLQGFTIQISDFAGPVSQDAFANPLGTTYATNPDGSFQLNPDGSPVVNVLGSGILTTDANGEVFIKYIPPGKYGIRAIPPTGTPWIQSSTIEGTPTVDAWVKAKEPAKFFEGFGTGFHHVFLGFVNRNTLPWAVTPPGGTGTITGRNVYNHFSRPPATQGFHAGEPVPECWVGLNDLASKTGLIAAACDGNSNFTFSGVPPGTYQLVTWDRPLDALFGFQTVTVPPAGGTVNLGDVLSYRWFANLEGRVFYDSNQNGFRDAGESGIPNQIVNLRFRDGSLYQTTVSDPTGEYALSEVFPFFKWLVAEVDFARFKATGMTAAVDYGGAIPPANGWISPSFGKLNPQPQTEINPNTGNNLSRTETGPVLTQATHIFLNQSNVIDWGKINYAPGENGGISGIVYYATTRAENNPRFAAAETWEPGIPRVQVCLYRDSNADGTIDNVNGEAGVQLCDVDNYPFGWADGGAKGPEDIDRNGNGIFDAGDAIQVAWTDSWDDNPPSGCIQTLPVINGQTVPECFDNFGTWNQVRPGLFNGGYAFTSYFPGGKTSGGAEVDGLPAGTYIVQAVPPYGYEIVKEEDKNVDFGDSYTPSPLATPPICVGDPHMVPAELSLFPGVAAPFAGQSRPLCDRKQVEVLDQQNTPADFYFFTEVPKAARVVGFVNNDLTAEFNANSPIFGEKAAPAWIPISIQDWAGVEVARVYSDEWGSYNALAPSTFTMYAAAPSGVSPNMLTIVLNHPLLPGGTFDPFYDDNYATSPWTLDYMPGKTLYADTPIVPIASFVGFPKAATDVEPETGSPKISQLNGLSGGPLVCTNGESITITSVGNQVVPNPDYNVNISGSPATVTRDFGFGTVQGTVTVGGLPLTITGWNNSTITATVDTGTITTGQLMVTRGDNGKPTQVGVTLHVGACGNLVRVPADFLTIQAAIDNASNGALIMVAPGTYNENVIMQKSVKLQGYGAESTFIYANPNPADRLAAWHSKVLSLLGNDPFGANEAPGIMVLGTATASPFPADGAPQIDGFKVSGAIQGGGIYVDRNAFNLKISNNVITGNQGSDTGGITLGLFGQVSNNTNVVIEYNRVVKNGGVFGGGGIAVYAGSTNYQIRNNIISGNLSRWNGGGIAHAGLSNNGVISNNKITFNEVFFGAAIGGDAGGIFVGGEAAMNDGSGTVTISGNLIQGNLTGAGSGGGIRALYMNGQDILDNPGTPANWYALNLFNNIIVNNVAAYAGGGIALQDAARVNIINNTIANNDSTGTSANAFAAGAAASTPQGAGIVSNAHTAALATATGQTFSNPVLTNNILWRNRSFYNDRTLNAGAGGLLANPAGLYVDLRVTGTTVAQTMDPQYCVLSDITGYSDPAKANVAGDPRFFRDYFNTLESANVLDEAGTSITVRFSQVKPAGNYHIGPSSQAYSAGVATALVTTDYDGQTRQAPYDIGADQVVGLAAFESLAVFRNGDWFIDRNYSTTWDGCETDGCFLSFGFPADTPVKGDWTGTGQVKIGVFRNGEWYLDLNGNAAWDGCGTDACYTSFGYPTDTPVTGDWTGTGTVKIGVFRNGEWFLDLNGNGAWDGCGTDGCYTSFGLPTDVPITGDWDGTGTTKIGVFRNGEWYLDLNGNGTWDGCGTDACYTSFGLPTDVPVTGDWTGSGTTKIGVFRNGEWYLDLNGNGAWDGCSTDRCIPSFGLPTDIPIVSRW
jgi:hypothetical protein